MPDFEATVYARAGGIVERQVDDSLFLAEAEGEAVFHLNPTGAALWRLLAQPTRVRDAAKVFRQAFPNRDRGDIESEIANLIAELEIRGLIVKHH